MNAVNRRWLSPSVKGIAVRFCAPCVPTWRRIIVSVAQADEVIIARHGDKCKMSIYEKNPSGEGFDFNWRLYVLRGI